MNMVANIVEFDIDWVVGVQYEWLGHKGPPVLPIVPSWFAPPMSALSKTGWSPSSRPTNPKAKQCQGYLCLIGY